MNQGFGSDELRLSNGRTVRLSSSKIVWLLCLYLQASFIYLRKQNWEKPKGDL